MKTTSKFFKHIDTSLLFTYICLITIGWVSIYAAGYHQAILQNKVLGLSTRAVKQGFFIFASLISFFVIFNINTTLYQSLSYIFYLFSILFMIGTILMGKNINGHNSWYRVSFLHIQPSEFAKIGTILGLCKYLDTNNMNLNKFKNIIKILPIIFLPIVIILLQGDAGSAIVFLCLIVPLYREGMPISWILKICIMCCSLFLSLIISKIYLIIFFIISGFLELGISNKTITKTSKIILKTIFVISVITIFSMACDKILKPHHINRIKTLVDPNIDPKGIGYNVSQSKIAIGSGGIYGKGFLKGTQTNFGFVPAQITDFIFCTIGEEHGLIGCITTIICFIVLFFKILNIAEKQKSKFARVYGYSIFAVLAIHFVINIGMTLGILPVIGIPLPFISYGGSSLLVFSILLFILLKIDNERMRYVAKNTKTHNFF